MAQFQLYNYQFGKIKTNDNSVDLFGNKNVLMSALESFPIRQDVFQMIIDEDYNGEKEKKIKFTHKTTGDKEYTHKHLMKPTDGIIVMRIANKKKQKRINKDLEEVNEDNYTNCLVIIDNRPGIQRMAIEVKKSAFTSDTMLCNIIQHTLNKILANYSLYIDLMHIQDPKDFWTFINDKKSYPKGFYKIKFHLPYLNLERLQKKYESLTHKIRESYHGKLDWEVTAEVGGELNITKEDKFQDAQINFFTKDLGGYSLELVPNDNKRKSIYVGKGSYQYIWVSDTTFTQLKDDAAANTLFGSSALDAIKLKMKEGTD